MPLLHNDNSIAEMIIGIIFFLVGLYILLNSRKVITALLSSNKVFWEKMGFYHFEKVSLFLTNIMIPFMGIVFFATGIFQICKILFGSNLSY